MPHIKKIVSSSDPDQCSEEMSLIGNVTLRAEQGRGFSSQFNIFRLPRLGVFSATLTNCRSIEEEERDFVAVTVGLEREFISRDQGKPEAFGSGESHILNSDHPLLFSHLSTSSMLHAIFYKPLLDEFEGKMNGGEEPSLKQFDPGFHCIPHPGRVSGDT